MAFESQARSHVIKLHTCLNSFSTTLYVHIFGSVLGSSVHANAMKTYNTTIRNVRYQNFPVSVYRKNYTGFPLIIIKENYLMEV